MLPALTVAALAAVVAASPLWATTASPTRAAYTDPITVTKRVAQKYAAAMNALNGKAMVPLFARSAVEIDTPGGGTYRGNTEITDTWTEVLHGFTKMHASLCCAGVPSSAGPTWAVVTWTGFSPPTTTTHGAMILTISNPGGLITHETLYYGLPGT